MAKAIWNGKVIAESEDVVEVEGNLYFPTSAVPAGVLAPSEKHTVCGWKGTASYFHLDVAGQRNADAAWTYPEPKPEAEKLAGRIAFWRGVQVTR